MKYLILGALLILPIVSFSISSLDSTRYLYAKNAPKFDNIVKLVNYLKIGASTDDKVVETFFYWIALNVEYDFELKNGVNTNYQSVSADSVFMKRKTICTGYSNLLFRMCKLANIECVIILGIGQNYIEKKAVNINHSWNAVLINKNWKLIDATWGSGGSNFNSESYSKNVDIRYLYADPKFFLIDHFPKESRWQLINQPISLIEFNGEYWKEMRFRKFNNLLDDDEYKIYINSLKSVH